jgi:hypothetical protein
MIKDPHARVWPSWSGEVGIMFIFDDLVPPHIREGDFRPFVKCHAAIEPHFWKDTQVELPFKELLLGVKFHASMAPWRPKMIAVLLSGHPRVGQHSLIGSLKADNLRRILELARPTPESGSGAAIGGGILRPGADSSLMRLMAGPQVDRGALLAVRHRPPPPVQPLPPPPPEEDQGERRLQAGRVAR